MGLNPSESYEPGLIYGYELQSNLTLLQSNGLPITSADTYIDVWTNITWPQIEGSRMGSGVLGLGLDSVNTYGSVWGLGDGFCTNLSPNFGIVQLNYFALSFWDWANNYNPWP